MTKSGTEMSIKHLHELLGHCNQKITRKIPKHLGWSIKHSLMKPCESCANARAKQKNGTKSSGSENSKVTCDRIYFHISTIKYKDGEETILRNMVYERLVTKSQFFIKQKVV